MEDAVRQVDRWDPAMCFVGLSLRDSPLWPWGTHAVGLRETREAAPVFEMLTKRGKFAHDHNPQLMAEALGARISEVETGVLLSAKRSVGPIPILKALCWAVWALESGQFTTESQIW